MEAVGERKITYDARGLVEPDATVPNVSEVDGTTAVFDAAKLTTRQINLELKNLLYERGITDVTVKNPGAKHSLGVGILTRCKITFDGSLGYFGCGVIDGPEVHITGRVGWSACENMMSGVVVIEGNAGSLTGAALRGGDLVVKGRARRVDRCRHGVHRPQVRHLRPGQPARVPEVRVRQEALQLRQPRAFRAEARSLRRRTRCLRTRPPRGRMCSGTAASSPPR